ncbi:putative DNA-binding transcriptional regulator YafY [Arthrobacter woluwensis]|uniref:helix-turn-helix transcriptional regulator n=1 Tax=Arthrobacter woluwensis TaxID=156980 RepID=UPI002783AD23|nr:WYL domain-containing protein [Arthrobacter woluwensis]MDQ0709247.1 putative DNA-binding transcriptional regulator YafY [Arthrobacter woluwensis]
MKASRLLHLLLLLQVRQRVTTTELAERLEVSRRTILRDVEALSAAGVPVYAERGRAGGIVLLSDARLNASHLDPEELEALSLTGLDAAQLDALGLSAAHQAAAHKIAARAAANPGTRQLARLADLVHVESTAWFADPGAGADVADLAWALRTGNRLRIEYRRSAEAQPSSLDVDPYGIVAKSGRWYLIADADGEGRLFALERLADYRMLEAPARLRDGETLRTAWTALKERTESSGRVRVTVRLRANRLDLARRILGSRLKTVDPSEAADQDGWCTAVLHYPDLESVRQLLQFGDHLEVLSPDGARDVIRRLAEDLALRHAPRPAGDG